MLRTLVRNVVEGAVQAFNLVSRKASMVLGQPYQLLIPRATYAPWLQDAEFMDLYQQLQPDSLVGLYQSWELWCLARESLARPGEVLEVGVWRGGSAIILGRALRSVDSPAGLYCCDTFQGLVKCHPSRDPYLRDGELSGVDRVSVQKRLRDFEVEATLLEGVFPDQTSSSLEQLRFSLCHIDVDSHDSTRDTLAWLWPRLVPGGVAVVQDYGFHRTPGAAKAVDALRGRSDVVVVHNLNGNAVLVKVESGA